ncbi:uncharacterized protein LOC143021977 [Oratosquilla oratoria]|uniref:uncharacterized protein LOC143021977 n=1 Tax=Oratosquilla oratoria TaxID=337810 RepID=UPI003F76A48F
MQRSMDLFTRACADFGLTISTNTAEVLHQPAQSAVYTEPHITTKGQRLTVTDKFTYLGSILSRSINIDEEETFRIAKASTAFGRLKQNVCERRGLRLDTKLKVYRAAILLYLPYTCETWTIYNRHT